jgi:hypothetical protein
MRTVHKYPIKTDEDGFFHLDLPMDAKVLHADFASNGMSVRPCLWALVDTGMPQQRRDFEVRLTGDEIPSLPEDTVTELKHLGTFIKRSENGGIDLLYHLFERVLRRDV